MKAALQRKQRKRKRKVKKIIFKVSDFKTQKHSVSTFPAQVFLL